MELLRKMIAAMKYCRETDYGWDCSGCPMNGEKNCPCTSEGEDIILRALEEYSDGDWFGKVRWCDEDIKAALRDLDFDDCEENVSVIRLECDHHCFTDGMIETGWHYISCYIQENEKRLKRKEIA